MEEAHETQPISLPSRDRLLRYGVAAASAVVIAIGSFALGRSTADDTASAQPGFGGGAFPAAPPSGMPSTGGMPGAIPPAAGTNVDPRSAPLP